VINNLLATFGYAGSNSAASLFPLHHHPLELTAVNPLSRMPTGQTRAGSTRTSTRTPNSHHSSTPEPVDRHVTARTTPSPASTRTRPLEDANDEPRGHGISPIQPLHLAPPLVEGCGQVFDPPRIYPAQQLRRQPRHHPIDPLPTNARRKRRRTRGQDDDDEVGKGRRTHRANEAFTPPRSFMSSSSTTNGE
jgi:hypothetical protein